MTRLPIADAIRFAYSFAFEQIGAIIGLVWLPLVMLAVLQFLPYAIGTAYSVNDGNNTAAAGAAFANLLFSTAAMLLYAMNCVSVTRQALGIRQGAATIHFALGWPEWRMFAAIVICGLILVAAIGVYALVGSTVLPYAGNGPLADALTDLYAVAGLCAIAWFALRLIFVLPPIIVSEERVDLARAWMLTRRNFWRLLAVAAAVMVPLLLIQAAALAAIAGLGLFAPLPGDTAAAAAALEQRFALFDSHMPTLIGLTLILTPFNLGLMLGASSFAYRTLAPAKPASRTA